MTARERAEDAARELVTQIQRETYEFGGMRCLRDVLAEALLAHVEHAERALAQMRADWEMYLSEPHDVFTSLRARLAEAEQRGRALSDALAHYAKTDRDTWQPHVIDKYSGQCWFFDWPGDLGDHPWDIAKAALSADTNDT